MTQYRTLLLDQSAWDIVIDSAGNIARAEPPYALAQDVASAVRLFLGELWYSTTKGVPYFEDVLGHLPPLSLMTGLIETAALTVPGVVTAQCIISSFDAREIGGRVQFIDETGAANGVTF
jgi:hypothetical protein